MRALLYVFGVLAICTPTAQAEAPKHNDPGTETLPTIPLPKNADAVPEVSAVQWNLVGDLQADAIGSSTDIPHEFEHTAELRRARISGVFDLYFDWRLRVSGDVGKYNGIRDVYVEYRGWPVYVAAGRVIEPFGQLQAGSSGASFMERPQPSALGPGYGIGLQGNFADDRWAVTAGVFTATQNSPDLGGRKEKAITARATGALYKADSNVVHVGMSLSRRASGEGALQFDALPETTLVDHLGDQSKELIADPVVPGTNKYWLGGFELAAHLGSVLIESEYLRTSFDQVRTINPNTGAFEEVPSPRYYGWYAEGSWLVTGEQRDYSIRRGTFGNVYPTRPVTTSGFGAIELAGRYSYTDLSYSVPYSGPSGDYGHITSIGVNWYPTDGFKVMVDWLNIHRETEDPYGNPSGSGSLVQGRFQYYFVLP